MFRASTHHYWVSALKHIQIYFRGGGKPTYSPPLQSLGSPDHVFMAPNLIMPLIMYMYVCVCIYIHTYTHIYDFSIYVCVFKFCIIQTDTKFIQKTKTHISTQDRSAVCSCAYFWSVFLINNWIVLEEAKKAISLFWMMMQRLVLMNSKNGVASCKPIRCFLRYQLSCCIHVHFLISLSQMCLATKAL